MAYHEISDFIDSIKESLTDAQYKEGMEMCQKLFEKKERSEKMYSMTYLRPYTFMTEHCEDEDCDDMKLCISFVKTTAIIALTDRRAEKIRTEHMFFGSSDEMKNFIDVEVLRSFPSDLENLGMECEWFEFPVLELHLIGEGQTAHTGGDA